MGNHTLEVEYVGLDTSKQAIAIAAGASTTLDVGLKSEVLRMAAFEVAEAARGQALNDYFAAWKASRERPTETQLGYDNADEDEATAAA